MSKPDHCVHDVTNALGQSLPRDEDDPSVVTCAQESLQDKDGTYFAKDDQLIRCAVDQYGLAYPSDGSGNQVIDRPNSIQVTTNADGAIVITLLDPNGNPIGMWTETDAEVTVNPDGSWTIIDDSGDVINIPAPIAPVEGDLTFTFADGTGPIVVDNNAPDAVPFDENFTVNAAGQICLRSERDTDDDGHGQRAFENTGLFTGAAVDAIVGTTVVDLNASATNPSGNCEMCYEVYLRGGNVSMRLGVPLTDAWLAQTDLIINGSNLTGGFKPSLLIQPNSSGPLFRITWSSNTVTRECIVAPGGTITAQIILDFIPPVYTPDAQNLFNGQRFNIAMIGKSMPVPC